jgi:uncharacterized membrane protein HdeD (DUF308 family)
MFTGCGHTVVMNVMQVLDRRRFAKLNEWKSKMSQKTAVSDQSAQESWLQRYYLVRAGFSIVWIAAVLVLAPRSAVASAALLICYPAWDALANFVDGQRSGGLRTGHTQLLNVIVSLAVTVALGVVLPDMKHALGVFGVWAILSGLLQLGTGLRRWSRYGAQWAMALSGAQSMLAGAFFLFQAQMPVTPSVSGLVGYAGFGAFYFLLSALLLRARAQRREGA